MHYVGVDLHKQSITVCVMIQERRTEGRRPATVRLCGRGADPSLLRRAEDVSSGRRGDRQLRMVCRAHRALADRVVLAHPKKLRVIAESTKKTDKLDAQVLAEFLALDMIPESWRPTPRVRDHRALVRYRYYLQRRSPPSRTSCGTSWPTTTPTCASCLPSGT